MDKEKTIKAIRVSAAADAAIRAYAKAHNITIADGASKLVAVAVARLAALAKYRPKAKSTTAEVSQ